MLRRRIRMKLVLAFAAVFLIALFSLHLPRQYELLNLRSRQESKPLVAVDRHKHLSVTEDDETRSRRSIHTRRVSSVNTKLSLETVSVLLADWEVLVISDEDDNRCLVQDCLCRFQNNATSPARFAGRLPTSERTTFKCTMPNSVRRLRPFLMPALTGVEDDVAVETQMPELYRWTFLVYDSLTTETDVVLFVKGVNHRQGMSRSPSEFDCVFHGGGESDDAVVKTPVTSSYQEVFRCVKPDLMVSVSVKVSLQIKSENDLVVPSVALYVPRRMVASPEPKKLLCASAMVYNAAKFLREWVTYHSNVGVDKFILYDNDSDDNLNEVISELNHEGFDVTTTFWIWPKTQEAGFSRIAIHGKDSCAWMMYVDIDEFVFAPSWVASSQPSTNMLKSLLPSSSPSNRPIGQLSIRCNEFGPSNQRTHPAEGVTQGYTCRRSAEQRHKSIVLLEAVDYSLMNVVHHFGLNSRYVTKTLDMKRAIVNHYKYQAWTEFRNKFRRRVSTYVVDWTQRTNLGSKDRTPGLGFEPIEPRGWDTKFCEVRDERLKRLTRRWFGSPKSDAYNKLLSWQR